MRQSTLGFVLVPKVAAEDRENEDGEEEAGEEEGGWGGGEEGGGNAEGASKDDDDDGTPPSPPGAISSPRGVVEPRRTGFPSESDHAGRSSGPGACLKRFFLCVRVGGEGKRRTTFLFFFSCSASSLLDTRLSPSRDSHHPNP